MSEDIKNSIDAMGSAFAEFKATNDTRLKEIESKGSADPLTEQKLDRINKDMSQISDMKARLEAIETTSAASFGDSEKGANSLATEYKDAFLAYARKGRDSGLEELEQKALSVGNDAEGGYTVTPVMSDRIVKKVFETSPMRRVAAVETISSDSISYLVDKDEAAAGGWVAEKATRSETGTPDFAKKTIYAHEQYADPKATQKILDDSSIDIEAWLAGKVAEQFTRQENTAFFTGDGVAKPRGILTYADGTSWEQIEQIKSTSGTGGTLSADDVIALLYGLKEEFELNASFLMARSTVEAVRTLKDTTNQYIWKPGLDTGVTDSLVGKPIVQCSDMPVIATDSLSIAVGDFQRAYQIVDRTGIRTLRDPYSVKGFVEFYTTKRVGGDVMNFEAIKLLKLDA